MATLTITVPDEQVDRVRVALAPRAGKAPEDMTAEDVRLAVVALLKRVVESYEQREAERAVAGSLVPLDAE
jgi:hypothetical protein